jgi:hypothetical protein
VLKLFCLMAHMSTTIFSELSVQNIFSELMAHMAHWL